jgi:hypothetical protein
MTNLQSSGTASGSLSTICSKLFRHSRRDLRFLTPSQRIRYRLLKISSFDSPVKDFDLSITRIQRRTFLLPIGWKNSHERKMHGSLPLELFSLKAHSCIFHLFSFKYFLFLPNFFSFPLLTPFSSSFQFISLPFPLMVDFAADLLRPSVPSTNQMFLKYWIFHVEYFVKKTGGYSTDHLVM